MMQKMKQISWVYCALLCLGMLAPQKANGAVAVGKAYEWDWAKKKVMFLASPGSYPEFGKLLNLAGELDNEALRIEPSVDVIARVFGDIKGNPGVIYGYGNPKIAEIWGKIQNRKTIQRRQNGDISFSELINLGPDKFPKKEELRKTYKMAMIDAISQAYPDYTKDMELAAPIDFTEKDITKKIADNIKYLEAFIAVQGAIDDIEKCHPDYSPSCLLPALQTFKKTLQPAYKGLRNWYQQLDKGSKEHVYKAFNATYLQLKEHGNNLADIYKQMFMYYAILAVATNKPGTQLPEFISKTMSINGKDDVLIDYGSRYVLTELKDLANKIMMIKLTNGKKEINQLISDIADTAAIIALLGDEVKDKYKKILQEKIDQPQVFEIGEAKLSSALIYRAAIEKLNNEYDKDNTEQALNLMRMRLYIKPSINFKSINEAISQFIATYENARIATKTIATTKLERLAKEQLEVLIDRMKGNISQFLMATQIITKDQLKKMQESVNENASTSTLGIAYRESILKAIETKPGTITTETIFSQLLPTLNPYTTKLANIKTSPIFTTTKLAISTIREFSNIFSSHIVNKQPSEKEVENLTRLLENVKTAILLIAKILAETASEYGEDAKNALKKNIDSLNKRLKNSQDKVETLRLGLQMALPMVKLQVLEYKLSPKQVTSGNYAAALEDLFFKSIREAIQKPQLKTDLFKSPMAPDKIAPASTKFPFASEESIKKIEVKTEPEILPSTQELTKMQEEEIEKKVTEIENSDREIMNSFGKEPKLFFPFFGALSEDFKELLTLSITKETKLSNQSTLAPVISLAQALRQILS